MSEPTRLKAAAAGVFVGAPLIALSVGALSQIATAAMAEMDFLEDILGGLGHVAIAMPLLIALAVGLPLSLLVASRPFDSAKTHPITYSVISVATSWLGAGVISFSLDYI